MRYDIRKVEKDGSIAKSGGYVIAPDWQVAGKRAADAGLARVGDSFVAIPAYGTVVRLVPWGERLGVSAWCRN